MTLLLLAATLLLVNLCLVPLAATLLLVNLCLVLFKFLGKPLLQALAYLVD